MNTQMSYSAAMPPPPPLSPVREQEEDPRSEWQQQQPQFQSQPQPQYYYPEPQIIEKKSSFFDSISKQILFLIFVAFVIGLFVGKSMNVPIIIQKAT
jgi:hypothetical protein